MLINNGDGTFSTKVSYGVGSHPRGIATGDIDGDLDIDLLVVNQLSDDVSVLLNNGDGIFSDQVVYKACESPYHLAIADIDGDFDLDIGVANFESDNLSVLWNNGKGKLGGVASYPAGDTPLDVAVGDLNGDDDADLVAANFGGETIAVFSNKGDGDFDAAISYTVGNQPGDVEINDLDGDLDLDLVVTNFGSANYSILLNNGNGTFAAAVQFNAGNGPADVAIGDFDGDLDLDLAVANHLDATLSIHLNNGNGTFENASEYNVGDLPIDVAVGDLDGDLDNDISVANFASNDVSLLLNNGDGTFQTGGTLDSGEQPSCVIMADVDDDGDLDMAVANQTSNDVFVWRNYGDATFASDIISVGDDVQLRDLAFGDIDGDMDLDIAGANVGNGQTSGIVILKNNNGEFTFVGELNVKGGPNSIIIHDLDGDYDQDLVTADFSGDSVSVLVNDCSVQTIEIAPYEFMAIRGIYVDGGIADVQESDDSYLKFIPGFTINSSEAPVWLIFDGTLPSNSPTSLGIVMESNVGTPGLTHTLEAWNWTSAAYDVIDVSMANFNNDVVVTVDLSSNISDYVESGTVAVRTRVGWAKPDLRSTTHGKFVWTRWFGSSSNKQTKLFRPRLASLCIGWGFTLAQFRRRRDRQSSAKVNRFLLRATIDRFSGRPIDSKPKSPPLMESGQASRNGPFFFL